jgi:hypothetical protein
MERIIWTGVYKWQTVESMKELCSVLCSGMRILYVPEVPSPRPGTTNGQIPLMGPTATPAKSVEKVSGTVNILLGRKGKRSRSGTTITINSSSAARWCNRSSGPKVRLINIGEICTLSLRRPFLPKTGRRFGRSRCQISLSPTDPVPGRCFPKQSPNLFFYNSERIRKSLLDIGFPLANAPSILFYPDTHRNTPMMTCAILRFSACSIRPKLSST